MNVFIELSTLTDGAPFGDTIPGTSWSYYVPVDYADQEDEFWSAITTPENIESKRAFWDRYALINRNKLVVVEDFRELAPGNVLIARDLNVCRQWLAAGGKNAIWLDGKTLRSYPRSESEFLAAVAIEGLDNAQ
jgi:hypothetical protein